MPQQIDSAFTVHMPSLCQDLTKNARQWPQAIAVSDGNYRWTWSELETVVATIAERLRSAGARRGTVVSVYMPNSATYVATVYAIWATGASFCPINYRLSQAEADRMMSSAGVSVVVATSQWDDVPGSTVTQVDANRLLDNATTEPLEYSAVDGDAAAWLFFTSGTSGTPKPAVITHRQIDAVVSNGVLDLMRGLKRSDAALAVAPLSHGALTHVLRQVRLGGHTVVYDQPRFDEARVLRLIIEEQVRSTFMVPTMVRRLCEATSADNYHGTLSHLLSGGEPITRDLVKLVERVFGRVLTNYYGLAEVTGAISQAPPEVVHIDSDGPVAAGQPRIGTSIELRRPDGAPSGDGEHGDIWVSGSNMFSGYLIDNRIDRSEIINGWFKTKDIGYFRDGCLYIDGRSNDMYISGGSNVYPAEVERVLNSDPDVKQAAVVGIPDEKWGEVGVAFIIPTSSTVNEVALAERVRRELAGYKIPRLFRKVESFPQTAMDKIDKRKLKERLLTEMETADGSRVE